MVEQIYIDGKKYTIDWRLQEFRTGNSRTGIEFIDFDDAAGQEILESYINRKRGQQ